MSAHILIVEDEPPLARNIEKFLAREGFEPIVEMNGEAALKTLERTRPDLVLLDFRLTGITGLEVLNRIRSEDSEIRVILMTAHASVALAVDAMKAGADDFLMKPLSLEALGHTIRRVLGHRVPRRILQRCGGDICLASEEDAGTTVTIRLPVWA